MPTQVAATTPTPGWFPEVGQQGDQAPALQLPNKPARRTAATEHTADSGTCLPRSSPARPHTPEPKPDLRTDIS
jgi:hypothetical protein